LWPEDERTGVIALLLVAGVLLLAASSLGAASLGLSSVVGFGLAAYLFVWAEVVGLTEVLSPLRDVGVAGYLLGEAAVLAVVLVIWWRVGRPVPSVARFGMGRAARSHPVLLAVGIVVGSALLYETVLGLSTPATNIDELWYHLSRAAGWLGHGGVFQIPAGNAAENQYPPDAEIGVLFGFAFLHRDMFATLPQLAAQVSLVLAIFGIARKLGFSRPAALFPALIAPTLSDIALESTTALNDIVVASFALAATYFMLGAKSRTELTLGGLAVGLALGTKYTAFFVLPFLGLLALATLSRRQLVELVASAAVGFTAFGSYGYIENLAHSGTPLGGAAQEIGSAPAHISARGTISTMARNAYRFIDLPGYRVKTRWLEPVASVGRDVFRLLHIPTAPPEASTGGSPFSFQINVGSNPGSSWYGPLGILLIVPISLVFAVLWVFRRTSRTSGILAICLPIYLLSTALAYRYTSQGRFFITPVALTLPLAAVLYRSRLLAGLIASIGALTLLFALAYNTEKPTGLRGTTPIWQLSRADAQSLVFGSDVRRLITRLEGAVPAHQDLGVEAGQIYFGYALYGPTLHRQLVPVSGPNILSQAASHQLKAIYVGPTVELPPPAEGWLAEHFGNAGTLLIKNGSR
jgi:4-amino-4-deoxy-L-arabinose transferase-like glycosyltransferase